MLRIAVLLVCVAVLGGCTMVDLGVARDQCPMHWEVSGPQGYASYGWPAANELLSADLFGGPNSGTIVSVDLWRLLHVELGLLGLGLGIGPFQIGGGFGFSAPHAPAALAGHCPFVEMGCCDDVAAAPAKK
ncbi:MAG: hypothetical protein ACT4PU_09755 [Planctomycetota bacterium]